MLIQKERVFLDIPLSDKQSVLEFVAKDAAKKGIALDETEMLRGFLNREEEYSTAVAEDVAIPHIKNATVMESSLYVLRLPVPIDWDSPDDYKVRLIMPILVPEKEAGTTHIQILSSIAVNLMEEDFKKALLEASTPEEVLQVLENVKLEEFT